MSHLETQLLFQIRAAGLPEPVRQFRAIPSRRFRWDFAWPEFHLLLEVQGGTWSQGRHSRGLGASQDCEKLNVATLAGWKCFHVTSDQLRAGKAICTLQAFFSQAPEVA